MAVPCRRSRRQYAAAGLVLPAAGAAEVQVLLVAPLVFLATVFGGALALHLRDRLHLILGFSAGAVLGVALFDLMPEAYGFAQHFHRVAITALLTGVGFLFYMLLDRMGQKPNVESGHRHSTKGLLGGLTLVTHSACDGLAIGFAFQVSSAIGLVVAAAVIAHDFSDGINTANVIVRSGGSRAQATYWVLADAVAPVAGMGATLLWQLPAEGFALVLSLFAGFFLYLGASDLIPESYHAHPKGMTSLATISGAILIYLAVLLAK